MSESGSKSCDFQSSLAFLLLQNQDSLEACQKSSKKIKSKEGSWGGQTGWRRVRAQGHLLPDPPAGCQASITTQGLYAKLACYGYLLEGL